MAKEVFDFYVREGMTDPITVELQDVDKDTRAKTAASLAEAVDVTWNFKPRSGGDLKTFTDGTGGKVSIVEPVTSGLTMLSPAVDDWKFADLGYIMWIVVTDGDGKVIDYPSERNMLVGVLDNS
ncbi:hypothetical protein ES705_07289 [subsurface metagenome]